MAIFKSFNDVVISMIDYLRLVQSNLDTKPGTVSRDLFVDSPAQEMADLYTQLRNIASLSSFFSSNGTDLDNLGSNFNVTRNPGGTSSGLAIFTTNILTSDVPIPAGSIVVANNGITYQVISGVTMLSTSSNVYKATATRLSTSLQLANITDKYAIEANVVALTPGTSGNIGPYSLVSQNITGISNVTNLQQFSGGTDPESDNAFRTRILSVFAGSNTGTSLGYTNTVDSLSGVESSYLVGPGNPLMTRDGTQVTTDSNGNLAITSAGTGGKVDIYILGNTLVSQVDTYIYNDKSGKYDPTNPLNDFILGQRGISTAGNESQRRTLLIDSDQLPYQPVNDIVSISGSSSGANFVAKYEDSAGVIHGNYELLKDTGDFGGSPFGFDRLRWISDSIELDNEQITKGIFNSADPLQFKDDEEILQITQDYSILNESVFVSSSNRSLVILKHTPIRSVSRVTNLTTGERYVIANQNPNGVAGEPNLDGNIIISGNSLPSGTDILQCDYIWIKPFDNIFDFDNLKDNNATRTAQDSVDWSFGNLIQNEQNIVLSDINGNLYIIVSSPVDKVLSVLEYSGYTSAVQNDGTISVAPSSVVNNVIDIRRTNRIKDNINDNAELFNTDSMSGTLTGTNIINLPTDTLAVPGDTAFIRFNSTDVFSSDSYGVGSFTNNVIYLPDQLVTPGTIVLVNYISSISYLLPETNISSLPITSSGNYLLVNNIPDGYQPTSYAFSGTSIVDGYRKASSNLRINVGSILSNGVLSIFGATMHSVVDTLVRVTSGGFTVDVQDAILSDIGTNSLPSSVRLAKIYSVELVSVDQSNQVTAVDYIYDIVNYVLENNSNDTRVALQDSYLSSTEFVLPQTSVNADNILVTGDILRITFYYINTDDNESIYFTKNGEQVSKNKYTTIDSISVNSGFTNINNIIGGVLSIRTFNQPDSNTVYDTNYIYVAPKENERITITYNYNSLIDTATLAVENVRPVTSDVLIKAAIALSVNVSIRIVILPAYIDQAQTVIQNAIDTVSSFLTATSLGTTVDSSDVVNVLYSVPGVDRVRVLNFSIAGGFNTISITAAANQYLTAGIVDIKEESR